MLDRTPVLRSLRPDVYHNSVFPFLSNHWRSHGKLSRLEILPPPKQTTYQPLTSHQFNNTHKLPNEARQSTHTLLSLSPRSEIAHTLKTHTQAHPINPPSHAQTYTQRSNGPPWGGGGEVGGGGLLLSLSPNQILHVAQPIISTTLSIWNWSKEIDKRSYFHCMENCHSKHCWFYLDFV